MLGNGNTLAHDLLSRSWWWMVPWDEGRRLLRLLYRLALKDRLLRLPDYRLGWLRDLRSVVDG